MKSVVHVAAKTCLTHSTRLACRFSAWEHLAAEITAFSMGLTHQQACLTKKAHNTHTHTHPNLFAITSATALLNTCPQNFDLSTHLLPE
jgi:hypothetical protein